MAPVTSLLGALWSQDMVSLEAIIERTEITEDLLYSGGSLDPLGDGVASPAHSE